MPRQVSGELLRTGMVGRTIKFQEQLSKTLLAALAAQAAQAALAAMSLRPLLYFFR